MEIPLPLQGLNQALPFADQPAFTARVAQNVRGRDPVTGRVRLSKRAGATRYVPNQVTTSKIARIVAAVYDSRRTTYAAQTPEQEWGADLKGSRRARAGCVDRQDNVYVVDGDHSVAKYNSAGRLVWTLKLPVPDDKHVVGTVDVDDNGNLYAAVSSGGDPETAAVWRFLPRKVNRQPEKVWEYTPGGFVSRLKARGDVLFLGVNAPKSETGRIVQLQGALSSGPVVGWSKVVSYPINDIALKSSGDVLFTSPANPTRGIDPRYPQFTEKTVDASLRDILGDDYQKRVWCDLDASKIEGLENNDPVTLWEDQTGNGRDLFASFEANDTPPVFQPDAINGKPAVLFRRADSANLGVRDALQSGTNPSGDEASAEQQRTIVPAYKGAQWVQFIVCRPSLTPTGTTIRNCCLWSMDMVGDGTGTELPSSEDMQVWVNRTNDGYATTYDASAGQFRGDISLVSAPGSTAYEGAASGTDGTGLNFPIQGQFDSASAGNDTGTVLLTIVWDAGQNPTTDDDTVVHCTMRVNGKPVDRWLGSKSISEGPFWLGRPFGADATNDLYRFAGHVARILTIRASEDAPNGLLTMPRYPRTIGTIGGTSVAVAWDAASDTELEKIEGVLMHEYGISHLAPTGLYTAPALANYGYSAGYDPGNYPHPYRRFRGPPTAEGEYPSQEYLLASPQPILGKLDGSKGKLQWTFTSASPDSTPTTGAGGMGYAVAVSGDRIYTIGRAVATAGTWPDAGYAADIFHVRCTIDKNTTGSAGYGRLGLDGAWADGLAGGVPGQELDWDYDRVRIDVDSHGNLYVPGAYTNSTDSLIVYQGNRGTSGTSNRLATVALGNATYAALSQKNEPAYRVGDGANDDFKTTVVSNSEQARAEYCFTLGASTVSDDNEIFQYRLVDATSTSGSPREITALAFSGGSLFRFDQTAATAPAGTGTLTNPVYTGNYVSAVQAFGKIYFTDGRRYFTYDPRLDVVSKWTATSGGKIPPRCRIVELWNGRVVLARAYDDPHGWHMSAQGDPLDWDFFPLPRTATMAVSSVSATAGAAPDMVNALIPASDDLLIVGCESSIWIMRGDPAANGIFDQVSNEVGIAFGRAWCRDPEGRVYFFSTKGGVYVMSGGGAPQSLTRGAIDREMRNIDLETNYVELAWNEEADGLHVLVIPYGTGGDAVTNWFMQRDPDGWFTDTYTDERVQPTAVYQLDADDPDARALLFGLQGGYIAKYDRDATGDSEPQSGVNTDIASSVIWGPFAPKGTRMKFRFMHPTFVLAADQSGCDVNLYVNTEPDSVNVPTWSDTLAAGRNAALPMRGTGEYVWLELEDRSSTTRWSVEAASIEATPAGRSRERA